MTPPIPQVSIFMILVVVVAVFAAIGVYRTLIKPDKPWHRWVTLVALTAVFVLPALTGWGPLQ